MPVNLHGSGGPLRRLGDHPRFFPYPVRLTDGWLTNIFAVYGQVRTARLPQVICYHLEPTTLKVYWRRRATMKLMASGDGDGYHEAVKEQRKEAAGRRDQHVKHNWAEAEQARYLAIKLLLEAGCRMEMASLLADAQGEVRAGGGR